MKHGVVRGCRQRRLRRSTVKLLMGCVSVSSTWSRTMTLYIDLIQSSSQLAVQVHESNSADTKVLLE